FDADPMAVRGMLDVWIRKGKAHKQSATSSCGSTCQACNPAATEVYIWGEATKGIHSSYIPVGCEHS
ncbi:MAG: hypothetical protein EP297_13380, partial [Gammaproteobacteria bacterium]